MANVVITGSTRGIGRGLAVEFMKRGHNVVVSSRRQADVDKAVNELSATGPAKVAGTSCDVTRKADVQALWDFAVARFGRVDFWINNAGRATSRYEVHELPEEMVHTLVDGNFKGSVFGSQVAISGFRRQGSGALYNMLGGSFDGKRLTPNMGVYSATKAADWLLTKYLVLENRNPDIIIGAISPGMLITENWFEEQKQMDPAEWQKIRPILNILCDYVETSTPWLVEQMLANRQSGRRIAWMSTGKLLGRFLKARLPGPKRDLFTRFGL
ncbi:MAG: SDR family oxidoreductase [Gammaproteobacteria bacterium]|jgi:NAD(P)-dependent dehydrogenase (short-subunit alcohol dehydrogenase family)|nr:SDR family oxidoreductase [Gammaproteobacteria bacterium]